MLTDEEILEMGFALEDAGLSHSEIDTYLEHYGVKGQKWGVRKQLAHPIKNYGQSKDGIQMYNRKGKTLYAAKKTQTRAARNVKRTVAFLAGGLPLIAYNAVARPVDPNSPVAKKTQSGKAYTAKLITVGILGTPLSALAYHQIAADIRPKKPKAEKAKPAS